MIISPLADQAPTTTLGNGLRSVVSWTAATAAALSLSLSTAAATGKPVGAKLDWVVVAKDRSGFTFTKSGRAFLPWGFNYDHDDPGRLIEDYWEREWPIVEQDFQEMKELGANVVRVHLQLGKFMDTTDRPNAAALKQLARLVALAERTGLYLDLTGLGCYHKKDVPAWYDALDEAARWQTQAHFWAAIAKQCANSPAVFCYDLMNEPVVGVGPRAAGDWLGPPFAGKHFVQFITLDNAGRTPHTIASAWIRQLSAAIRKHDPRHLITVGLVDWSLDRPGLRSGFVPDKIAADLDFLCVHIYPEAGGVPKSLETLRGFAVGKPVVIEETFPLKCGLVEFEQFVKESRTVASGWVGFYWGKTLEEYRRGQTITDAIMADWLNFFQKHGQELAP
jgi:hypothetical protein